MKPRTSKPKFINQKLSFGEITKGVTSVYLITRQHLNTLSLVGIVSSQGGSVCATALFVAEIKLPKNSCYLHKNMTIFQILVLVYLVIITPRSTRHHYKQANVVIIMLIECKVTLFMLLSLLLTLCCLVVLLLLKCVEFSMSCYWCLNRHLCILPERFAKKDLNLVIVCRKDVML